MNIKIAATLLALTAGLSAAPLPVLADPPPWAPAHGYRAKHRYVYYPQREIYYEPEARSWFWLDGGNWRVGASLPAIYQPFVSGGVSIELDTDRPYTEHRQVVAEYGGRSDGPGKGNGQGQGKGNKGKH